MELIEAMSTARAIRRYRPDPVSDDDLLRCLQAATYAPSGSNEQHWRFCVLRSSEARELLSRSYRQSWDGYAAAAKLERPADDDRSRRARFIRSMFTFVENFHLVPAYVVFCAKRTPFMEELYTGASIYPAVQNFMLAARELGLGTVMTTWYRACEEELRRLLGVPDGWVIAGLVSVGYPVGHHGPVRRRPVEEVACLDHWDAPFTGS